MRTPIRKSMLAAGIGLTSALTVMLGACGTTSTNNGNGNDKAASQVLHLALNPGSNDIATMDPDLVLDAYSIVPVQMVFPQMLELDSKLNVQPSVATSWDISADGKTYTFHLRSGVKWSDGEPVDATAFATSLDRTLNPCTASPANYYLLEIKDSNAFAGEKCVSGKPSGSISTLIGDSIVVQDPQTLQITLTEPAGYFLEALTYPTSYALPVSLVNQYPTDWTHHLTDGSGMGGNLFTLTSWDHAGHMVLKRNDSFWGQKAIVTEVDFTIYKDVQTQYSDFQTGKIDVGGPPSAQYAAASKLPNFHQIGILQTDYDAMNWKMKPFDDATMRQAFDLAINKQSLAQDVLHGTVQATNHIVPQGMPGYNANLTGPNGAGVTGDAATATQLEQAYVQKNCGGQASKCPPVTFTITSGSQDLANEAAAELQMWQTAFPGYPIKIQTIEFNTLLNELNAKTVQFWAIAWIADYPDPQDWLSLQFLPTSVYNNSGVNDAQATSLMQQADAMPASDARLQLYEQAEQILVNDVAWMPTDQPYAYWVQNPKLKNYVVDAQGDLSIYSTWPNVYLAA